MQSTRDSFIAILKQDFINPEVKKTCIESSLQKIKAGLVTRAFDDYPNLMAMDELLSITDNFESLLKHIAKVNDTHGKMELVNNHDKRVFEAWEKNIITHACVELLDEHGKIKSEIVELLEWKDCVNKINVFQLISAYVGAINHATMLLANKKSTSELLQVNKTNEIELMKHAAVTDYINKNIYAWIINVTKLLNLPVVIERKETVKHTTVRKGKELSDDDKLAIGVGAGLFIAGAAALGLLLFSKSSNSNMDSALDNVLQPRL